LMIAVTSFILLIPVQVLMGHVTQA
jgi:hypothetical protein